MKIKTIKQLQSYISRCSSLPLHTVKNVIEELGYPLEGSNDGFNELSDIFVTCAKHGAKIGISGFIESHEIVAFYKKNQKAIVTHMEQTAVEMDTDIISMVLSFNVFICSEKPTVEEIGKALWDRSKTHPELTELYNVFSWYLLEEVSNAWYRYLEENPSYKATLSA